MIARLDEWTGRKVFVPAVIWICQRAGTTQWRFHNYAWMLASWLLLYAAGQQDLSAIGLYLGVATYFTSMAAMSPDHEGTSFTVLRRLFLIGETIHWGAHALYELGLTKGGMLLWGINWDASCPVGLIVLAAEYALTIHTIPPLKARERRPRRAKALEAS